MSTCWSEVQRNRLAIERDILQRWFADKVKWIRPTEPSEARVELDIKSSYDKPYKLRLYLHEDFPNSCPHMAIVNPANLLTRNNSKMPLLDKRFHTLGLTKDGFTKLCHFSPDLWTAENTLYQVLIKGIMWIEAYEGHLETGNSIDTYLGEQLEAVAGQNERSEARNPTIDGESHEQPEEKSSCCIS